MSRRIVLPGRVTSAEIARALGAYVHFYKKYDLVVGGEPICWVQTNGNADWLAGAIGNPFAEAHERRLLALVEGYIQRELRRL